MTWPKLVELGAPKMEGQFFCLGPNIIFQIFYFEKNFLNKIHIFSKLDPLDYV
jgi:hypothetical protein